VLACIDALPFRTKAFGFLFPLNDVSSLSFYLGAIQAGHAIAALNPELDPEFRTELIHRFQPDFIIAPAPPDGAAWNPGERYGKPQPVAADMLMWIALDPYRHAVHPDVALLISTSGSTGSPRFVRLSFNNLLSNAEQINLALANSEADCAMLTTPIFNGYGQSVIHTNLLAGGSFVLTRDRIVSPSFWATVRGCGCSSIGGTPYFYQVLDRLNLHSLRAPALKKFVQTGGRLAEDLTRRFHGILAGRGGELNIMYGQAEATARISGLPPHLLPDAARSVGFALSGGRLRIRRTDHEESSPDCGPGEEGELVYQGPNVMMGYATGPQDLARGDLMGGILATGDLGHCDERGLFYITGRKARFVKLFGWRVNLDDVEEMLGSASEPVAVTGEGERVVVFHEGAANGIAVRVAETAERLRLHPSGFEVRAIHSIPRLPNGKTDYRALVSR
jgi:acyl-CoA synthetase (AMP-forming)/AMP-acid ligase II